MWSQSRDNDARSDQPTGPARDKLLAARRHMAEALTLLDSHSLSPAAASLDMALHQLDRELSRC